MGYLFNEFDDKDIGTIKGQLKSGDIRISGIIERCCWNYPSIVLLYPARDDGGEGDDKGINFMSLSTLIWLTCPFLNDKIHELESDGYVKKISDFIADDGDFMTNMNFAHAHYFFLRKKVFRYFLGDVSSLDENTRIFTTGIGGVKDVSNIKCLHVHYAHFRLCENNLVGRIAYQLLNREIYCKERICDYAGP